MSSISKVMIDLSECAELRWLASVVADIAAANLRTEPILVGALARDVLLQHAHGIDTGRATQDADFAIAVADWDDFQQVKDRLLAGGAFKLSRRSAHGLRHRALHWIDLVPFGATAVAVGLPGGEQVRSVCLPMLVALKLIAWEDRRERADDRDAEDLLVILENYLDAGNLGRYPHDSMAVLGDELDHATVGALLAGRDLRGLLVNLGVSGAAVQESLIRILSRELEPDGDGTLAFAMAGSSGDYAFNLMQAFRSGLNH